MRIRISRQNTRWLFKNIEPAFLANKFLYSRKSIKAWRLGHSTLPVTVYKYLRDLQKLTDDELRPSYLDRYWYVKAAAIKGGRAAFAKHGNFGTKEGRKLGGLNSIVTHRTLKTDFKRLKVIKKALPKTKLAELLGVLFGDGHLSDYQVSVTTSSITDIEHAVHVQNLLNKHFGLKAAIRKKKNSNALDVVMSSKAAVDHLHSLGMPKGRKIKAGLTVPDWIKANQQYTKNFIKGLFDTDGCIYLDKHLRKGKLYTYRSVAITTYSQELMTDLVMLLKTLQFKPSWVKSQKSVYLRKRNDVERFFKTVGSNNPKHLERYKRFGGVPKWS